MSMVAGIEVTELGRLVAGVLRYADELEPGMHVRLPDARWAVVVGPVEPLPDGRVVVPVVTWSDVIREVADASGASQFRADWWEKVPTRNRAEQRAFVEAMGVAS